MNLLKTIGLNFNATKSTPHPSLRAGLSHKGRGYAKRHLLEHSFPRRGKVRKGGVNKRLLYALPLHRIKKILISLRRFQTIQQKLNRSQIIHRMKKLAQYPHFLHFILASEQFFAASTRTININRWENTTLSNAAIQVDFHITRAFEFFVNHIIHL